MPGSPPMPEPMSTPVRQRSSSEMAAAMRKRARIPFGRLRPGDLMLYGSGKKPASIYHVDVYIGNGWALDSGGRSSTLNVVIGFAPDRPASSLDQDSETPEASGVTSPSPVMTTLRIPEAAASIT